MQLIRMRKAVLQTPNGKISLISANQKLETLFCLETHFVAFTSVHYCSSHKIS